MTDLLQQAIAAIKAGDKVKGQQLIAQVLKADPRSESAWIWMSGIVDTDKQRRDCLEKVLSINPNNAQAKMGLEKLSKMAGLEQPPAAPVKPAAPPAPPAAPAAVPLPWEAEQPAAPAQPEGGDDLFGSAAFPWEAEQPAAPAKTEGGDDLFGGAAFPWEGEQPAAPPAQPASGSAAFTFDEQPGEEDDFLKAFAAAGSEPPAAPSQPAGGDDLFGGAAFPWESEQPAAPSAQPAAGDDLFGAAGSGAFPWETEQPAAGAAPEGSALGDDFFGASSAPAGGAGFSFDSQPGQDDDFFKAFGGGSDASQEMPFGSSGAAGEEGSVEAPDDFLKAFGGGAFEGASSAFAFEPDQPDLASGESPFRFDDDSGEAGQGDLSFSSEAAMSASGGAFDSFDMTGNSPEDPFAVRGDSAFDETEPGAEGAFGGSEAFGSSDAFGGGAFEGTSSAFGFEEEGEEALAQPQHDFDAFMQNLNNEDAGERGGRGPLDYAPQIWTNPKSPFDRVVILSDEYLIAANPDAARIPDIEEAVAQGQILRKQLGRSAKAIPLEKVTKVTANLNDVDMDVYYSDGKDLRMVNTQFADAETRNQALGSIQEKIGERFERTEKQYSRLRGLLAPLAVGFVILVMTALCYLAAADVHNNPQLLIDGTNTLREMIFGGILFVIPPFVFLCIGGVLLLGAGGWLATNLRTPPLMVTLAPKRIGKKK